MTTSDVSARLKNCGLSEDPPMLFERVTLSETLCAVIENGQAIVRGKKYFYWPEEDALIRRDALSWIKKHTNKKMRKQEEGK